MTASEGCRGTDPMNRYPRLGTVSIRRGESAGSSSAWRKRLTAEFSPTSKSTNVRSLHRRRRNSSRVTTSPGRSSSATSTRNGCSRKRTAMPCFSRRPLSVSTSNGPKCARIESIFGTSCSAVKVFSRRWRWSCHVPIRHTPVEDVTHASTCRHRSENTLATTCLLRLVAFDAHAGALRVALHAREVDSRRAAQRLPQIPDALQARRRRSDGEVFAVHAFVQFLPGERR